MNMLKTLYAAAWILVVLTAVLSLVVFAHPAPLLGSGLAALALIYGLAGWLVVTNTREPGRATI